MNSEIFEAQNFFILEKTRKIFWERASAFEGHSTVESESVIYESRYVECLREDCRSSRRRQNNKIFCPVLSFASSVDEITGRVVFRKRAVSWPTEGRQSERLIRGGRVRTHELQVQKRQPYLLEHCQSRAKRKMMPLKLRISKQTIKLLAIKAKCASCWIWLSSCSCPVSSHSSC